WSVLLRGHQHVRRMVYRREPRGLTPMLRGPLHDRGPGRLVPRVSRAFPCPTGLAIYNSVVRPEPAPVRSEDLGDRWLSCPRCSHFWVDHGVPTEDGYGCRKPNTSMDERELGHFEECGCRFAEGNPVTPSWVRFEPLN